MNGDLHPLPKEIVLTYNPLSYSDLVPLKDAGWLWTGGRLGDREISISLNISISFLDWYATVISAVMKGP